MRSGIVYMLAGVALLAAMDALAKWLTTHGVSVVQLLALRSLIVLPLLFTAFYFRGRSYQLRPIRPLAHAARGMTGVFAPLCFFLGIGLIPLTDAVLVSFSAIFIVAILAIIFLGERPGIHRWCSIAVGFIGVLIVTNPDGGGSRTGYALILLSSLAYAIMMVSNRFLTKTESVPSLVFSYNLCVAVFSLSLLPWFWTSLLPQQYLLIFSLALLALVGQYLITLACSKAEASFLSTFEYTAIIWAIIFDLFIWSTTPSDTTLLGAVLIIASGLYLIYREQRHAGQSTL